MEKIIIENRTALPMQDIMSLIISVLDMGRISDNGNQFSHLTVFEKFNVAVATDKNKRSDKFTVYERFHNQPLNSDKTKQPVSPVN